MFIIRTRTGVTIAASWISRWSGAAVSTISWRGISARTCLCLASSTTALGTRWVTTPTTPSTVDWEKKEQFWPIYPKIFDYIKPPTWNISMKHNLLWQDFGLQISVSEGWPLQRPPPTSLMALVLVLVLIPSPQVVVHRDQALQVSQVQSATEI